jgi:hypothetical protein
MKHLQTRLETCLQQSLFRLKESKELQKKTEKGILPVLESLEPSHFQEAVTELLSKMRLINLAQIIRFLAAKGHPKTNT